MAFSAQLGPGSLCSVVLICCGCWLKVFSIVGGACGVLPALLFLERTFALDMLCVLMILALTTDLGLHTLSK